MEKKNNKSIIYIIIIIILSVVVSVFSYFLFINKDVICDVDKENSNEKIESNPVELSIENPYIKKLYSNVHYRYTVGVNTVFEYSKRSVSEMSDYEKSALAANIYSSFDYSLNPADTVDPAMAIDEEAVKNAYEFVFGEGTYKTMDSISYTCGSISYNASTKRYESPGGGCGGARVSFIKEAIIKATKYEDRIEIVAANVLVHYVYNTYSKDDQVLGTFADRPSEEEIINFIRNNSDKLQQYTYTFKLGNDGFYYYDGFERTKE